MPYTPQHSLTNTHGQRIEIMTEYPANSLLHVLRGGGLERILPSRR